MIKKASTISIIFGVNTLIQLINQIIITRLFGATLSLDVFLAAVALPTVFVTVLYGTISDAFLPFYTRMKIASPEETNKYFLSHLFKIFFIVFAITIFMIATSGIISHLLYANRGEQFVKDVTFQMQLLFSGLPFAFIASIFGSYLYAHKQFIRFPIVQAIGNAVNLLVTIALAPYFGIWSLIIAFIGNLILQVILVMPKLDIHFSHVKFSVKPFIYAWIPLMVATFAARSDNLLIRSLSSSLPEGYLVYLNLTSRMFSIAAGVATIGIQVILLPHLVEHIAAKNFTKAKSLVVKSKLVGSLVSVITAGLLWLIAPVVIHVLFVGGKFTKADAQTAITLLPIFLFPAIGWGVQSIFFQPLMAIRKYPHLAVLNLIALVLGWGSGIAIQKISGPFQGLTFGLIIMVFSGIIGSEILWQYFKKSLST